MQQFDWIKPIWPAPENITCISTTRSGGFSKGNYSSLNLSNRVDDNEQHVKKNRQMLREQLKLKNAPNWLDQQHGTDVIQLTSSKNLTFQADAAFTTELNTVCVVLTADCLPILFCDREGKYVAAAHAGWRGLFNGVIENTINALPVSKNQILCWLGPAIGPNKFEVGEDLEQAFIRKNNSHKEAFRQSSTGKCLADIYQLARNILINLDVINIYGGGCCTYTEHERFYSYRRDGKTGRMATMIWINS